MVKSQTVRQSVNKKTVIGFDVTTTNNTSTAIVSSSTIASAGGKTITDIHIYVLGADGYLGLGKTATTTVGADIVPVFAGTPFTQENCGYESLNVIREEDGGNVRVVGYVVIN